MVLLCANLDPLIEFLVLDWIYKYYIMYVLCMLHHVLLF